MKAYAGIGSRSTPTDVLKLMHHLALELGRRGWTLRSGGADGADTAFEQGAESARLECGQQYEIYLPWDGFNGRPNAYESPTGWLFRLGFSLDEEIAAQFHPAWDRCSPAARKLHTRNVAQILGSRWIHRGSINDPDPEIYEGRDPMSQFVVCWTPGGAGGGGTGQALRIAKDYLVPIFDLADCGVRHKVEQWLTRERATV